MSIPPFDGILNVLPPHVGDPAVPGNLSPYSCTTEELCRRFAASPARRTILDGFLRLRAELLGMGIQGFQWLDGSFVEDIAAQEGREPNDIDVLTFVISPSNLDDIGAVFTSRPELFNRAKTKLAFRVDHFVLPLCSNPVVIVDNTRYWYGLFSHRRAPDRAWKGMLRVELTTSSDDEPARRALAEIP